MKRKLTRRNLLGTLGATAGVAATSCGQTPLSPAARTITATPGRVNLICHGQMLFLWPGADYIQILLPEPPLEPRTMRELHKIYLGGRKGKNPDNVLPQPPFTGPKQFMYDLTIIGGSGKPFIRKRSAFRGGPRPGEDVVLKDLMNMRLLDNMVARYTLTVPYPTDVRRFMIMDLSGNPVFGGKAATDLDVNPRYMGGVHVFTYDDAAGRVSLKPPTGGTPADLGPTVSGLNIHLYSQPDALADLGIGDHLAQFNGLVSYHNSGKKPVDLMDLKADHHTSTVGSAPDLADEDLYSLYDLATLESKATEKIRGAEPVECLQGWGT